MTDDNNSRFRSNDHHDRGPDPAAPHNDPLAELARLIGQNDPFAELDRQARSAAREPQHSDQHYSEPQYNAEPEVPAEWHNPPAQAYDSYAPEHAPQGAVAPEPHYVQHTDAAEPQAASSSRFGSGHYRSDQMLPDDYGAPAFGRDAPFADHAMPERAPPPPELGAMPTPHSDAFYDDAPAARRSRPWVVVLAVLMLAAVGSGAAFGYRAWFGGPGTSATPPVIQASAEPTKVAPPPAKADTTNKLSYDRFPDRSQNEQVVVREEKPVDPKSLVATAPPAAAPAAAPVATPPAAMLAPAPAETSAPTPAVNPPSVLTEPKRVRTVAVRPDQPDAAAQPQPVTPPPMRKQAAPAPAAANAPLDVTPNAAPAPRTPNRPAVVAPPQAPAPSANAPLSLAPNGTTAPPPPARARAAATQQPMRIASAPNPAPAATATGGYLVQVSSQRSEADAQTAFRNVKSKYSSVLGDRQPVIRRADLGAKGTYYRAMIGPFVSRDQAVQLCASLKVAGGDCVIQSN